MIGHPVWLREDRRWSGNWGCRYRASEKGRRNYQEYYRSEEGQAAYRRYHQGERRQEFLRRYIESGRKKEIDRKSAKGEKAKKSRKRRRDTPEYRAYVRDYYSRPGVRERVNARMRIAVQRRKSRKNALPATLTGDEWIAAMEHFDYCCVYCGRPRKLTQDHFVPLTLGGPYTRANIVPACKSCNSAKSNNPPEQWCEPEVYARVRAYFDSVA